MAAVTCGERLRGYASTLSVALLKLARFGHAFVAAACSGKAAAAGICRDLQGSQLALTEIGPGPSRTHPLPPARHNTTFRRHLGSR